MKVIASWAALEPFGIVPLTGESCGLSYRLLCDLTENGRRIVAKCFGLPELSLAESWNSGAPADPHVGSILFAPEMCVPLAVFALLESGCSECWRLDDGQILGLEAGDGPEQIAELRAMVGSQVVRRFAYGGTAGDRNVHQMTRRVQ